MSFYEVYEIITPYIIVALIGFIMWILVSTNKEIERISQVVEKEENTDIHK